MKKIAILTLAALMVPSIALAEGPRPISVYLKGENMVDTKKETSIIRENRTYLPLRVIAEDLGFKVDWNQEKKQVKISNEENQVTMRIGSKNYSHNQEKKEMDVKPFVDSNKTYVPIRFVGEALGSKVDWDKEIRMVLVGDYKEPMDMKEGDRVIIKGLNVSYVLPLAYRDRLMVREERIRDSIKGAIRYSIYDKMNYDSSKEEIGRIGAFDIEKNPVENPVPHIILEKTDKGYICFSFASDVQADTNNPKMIKSYQESKAMVREILKTVEIKK